MPKAIRWMRCTSIPQTCATSRLWETARIALPSRVACRKTKAAAVMTMAKPQAIEPRLREREGPERRRSPVRYSTERRSEVNASWARFTSAMETPKVSSSEDSSGASTTRRTRKRWSTSADHEQERHRHEERQVRVEAEPLEEPERRVGAQHQERAVGDVEHAHHAEDEAEAERHHRVERAGQQARDDHLADHGRRDERRSRARRREQQAPAGVPAGAGERCGHVDRWLPLVPGRRRVARLAIASSSGHTIMRLPSCHWSIDHLVRDLEAVLVDRVVAERRLHLQLEQLVADLVGVERCPPA